MDLLRPLTSLLVVETTSAVVPAVVLTAQVQGLPPVGSWSGGLSGGLVQAVAECHGGALHRSPRAVMVVAPPASNQAPTSLLKGVSSACMIGCLSSTGQSGRACSGSGLLVVGFSGTEEGLRQGQSYG